MTTRWISVVPPGCCSTMPRRCCAPAAVGSMMRANIDLLAVEDIDIAVTDRGHLDARQVGPGGGFRQQLPTADFASIDRRQESLFLLVCAPDADTGAAHLAAAVIIGRQAEAEAGGFLLQHDDLIQAETAAAILLFARRVEPALGAQAAAELSAHAVDGLRFLETAWASGDPVRHVRGEPGSDFVAELFLRLGVFEFEFHGFVPSRVGLLAAQWGRSFAVIGVVSTIAGLVRHRRCHRGGLSDD